MKFSKTDLGGPRAGVYEGEGIREGGSSTLGVLASHCHLPSYPAAQQPPCNSDSGLELGDAANNQKGEGEKLLFHTPFSQLHFPGNASSL